ncbi:hypothetical protein ABEB36_008639 [Hypothenemus hampei]|uniref:HMG box domain-containing protein n=1 Tax=Hypothenemus hampei TaxID=57062 RepID=A0ABD1EMN1_HYPHA
MMSDESENDIVYEENQESDLYYNKYKLLLEECSQLQRANEILVFRIQEVNKITKRRHKEVQFFRHRLMNIHDEDWSVIPPEVLSDEDVDIKPNIHTIPKKEIKLEKTDDPIKEKQEKPKSEKQPKSTKRPPRKKLSKTEKDPNAPKRPSNPFFQFCQEQRQLLMEQITSGLKPGEVEPTKQELTRQLALKWNSLSPPDKKVYVDRYERSKEKYNAEMEDYKRTK